MKKQEIKIVLGMAFGDEGKGNTVQYLCKQALAEGKSVAVVRFCGGAQAGHRVVHNGISHVCSSFGSGVLLGVPTIYLKDTVVDPIAMMNEYSVLKEKGIDAEIPWFDTQTSMVTTPYDVAANQNDEAEIEDGSCGKGVWKTVSRYNNEKWRPIGLEDNLRSAIKTYGGEENDSFDEEFTKAFLAVNSLKKYKSINIFDVLIFEGTQGLLLDADYGFRPNVTATQTGLNAVPSKYLTPDTEVYLVTRTYTTRHGNGYEPMYGNTMKLYYNLPKEVSNLDDGYQGKFKTGWFDSYLLNRAIDRHHLDNYDVKYHLVITHCDCIKQGIVPDVSGKATCLDDVQDSLNLDFQNVLYFNSEEA